MTTTRISTEVQPSKGSKRKATLRGTVEIQDAYTRRRKLLIAPLLVPGLHVDHITHRDTHNRIMFMTLSTPSVFLICFNPLGGLPPFTRPTDTSLRGKDMCQGCSMVTLPVLLLVKRKEKQL